MGTSNQILTSLLVVISTAAGLGGRLSFADPLITSPAGIPECIAGPAESGVSVCRNITSVMNDSSELSVTYEGKLLQGLRPQLSIFIKLNNESSKVGYEVGVIPMNCAPSFSRAEPNGVVHACGFEATSRIYNNPMAYLFTNANRTNAWDIEVAFVDSSGNWDSLNAQNYRFHFDAK